MPEVCVDTRFQGLVVHFRRTPAPHHSVSTELPRTRGRKPRRTAQRSVLPSLQCRRMSTARIGRMSSTALARNTARPRASSNDSARHTSKQPSVLPHLTNQEALHSLSPRACSFCKSSKPTQEVVAPPEVMFHDSGQPRQSTADRR